MLYTLCSTEYLERDADPSVCYIDQGDYTRRLEDTEMRRLFAEIHFDEDVSRVCAVEHVESRYIPPNLDRPIFLPLWMIPDGITIGEMVDVEFQTQDAFPEATRIVLKPLDSAFYSTDAKEMLTNALTRLGVLEKESIVSLKLEELGGYEMGFYIVELEPANKCLMDGEEVVIEFEEAADQWDGRRPGTPIPEEPPMLEIPTPTGNILGGVVRRMPDGRAWNPYRQG